MDGRCREFLESLERQTRFYFSLSHYALTLGGSKAIRSLRLRSKAGRLGAGVQGAKLSRVLSLRPTDHAVYGYRMAMGRPVAVSGPE